MENHPIPQDVTGFKFKLIGSVTVKQFLYLLGFGILTTVAFILHVNIFLKVPLMGLFALIGVSLAFVPIEGRPMDVMLANFAKAIPSENRYVFRKRGVNLSNYEVFKTQLKQAPQATNNLQQAAPSSTGNDKRAILISRLRNSTFRPDESEIKTLDNIKAFFEDSSKPRQSSAPAPQINQQKLKAALGDNLGMPPAETSVPAVHTLSPAVDAPREPDEDTIKKITEAKLLAQERARIEFEKGRQKEETQAPVAPVVSAIKVVDEVPHKPVVEVPQTTMAWAPSQNLAGGFPSLPDVPNVVLGITKDARGKSLPNVLVEIVDQNNIPVRAFKTNALGQFASATPLPNGVYKVSFEDSQKQHEFGAINIELKGEIFQPIVAVSIDAREKLRRELFGGTATA